MFHTQASAFHWRKPLRDAGSATPGRAQGLPTAGIFQAEVDDDGFEDKEGEELGNQARVWRVYRYEAAKADESLVQGWRDTLDVLLVFAGLFSAVVTGFLVQAYQALQPDYSHLVAALSIKSLEAQQLLANVSIDSSLMISALTPFKPAPADIWVNAFWFTSLALSLSTALLAVLIKQWLLTYTSKVSRSIRESVHRREFRHEGLKKWRVADIIHLLPQLLSLALLLFFAGLIILLFSLHHIIAKVVALIVCVVYTFYFLSGMIPLIIPQCPYRAPPSFFHFFFRVFSSFVPRVSNSIWEFPYGASLLGSTTFSDYESAVIQSQGQKLESSALASLYWSSTNPIIQDIVLHSLSALSRQQELELLVTRGLHIEIMQRLRGPASQLGSITHEVPQSHWAIASENFLLGMAFDSNITRLARGFLHFSEYFTSTPPHTGLPPESTSFQPLALQWTEVREFAEALKAVWDSEQEKEESEMMAQENAPDEVPSYEARTDFPFVAHYDSGFLSRVPDSRGCDTGPVFNPIVIAPAPRV